VSAGLSELKEASAVEQTGERVMADEQLELSPRLHVFGDLRGEVGSGRLDVDPTSGIPISQYAVKHIAPDVDTAAAVTATTRFQSLACRNNGGGDDSTAAICAPHGLSIHRCRSLLEVDPGHGVASSGFAVPLA
jgi:hypothetical protein